MITMLSEDQLTDRLQEFERACQAAGIKLTHQRAEVLREVARSHGHPSADAILDGVKSRIPTVSIDTVYRTLWLLTDLGLIATLGPRRDAVRFDANLAPHHHYVCDQCGVAIDVETLDLDKLQIAENLKDLGQVDSAYLEIRGVCAQCQAARAAAASTT
jgi:Fur family transcriptional regulator, peroxide stress response regulator